MRPVWQSQLSASSEKFAGPNLPVAFPWHGFAVHTVGKRIKAARTASGLTLEQVGSMVGRSKGHLSNIENDNGKPGLGLVVRLAVAFRVPLSALVTDDEDLARTEIAYGDEEIELIRTARRMDPEAKRGLLALIRASGPR